jgi:hypothetical protein
MGWKEDAEIDLQPMLDHPEYGVPPICTTKVLFCPVNYRCALGFHLRDIAVLLMPVTSESSLSWTPPEME